MHNEKYTVIDDTEYDDFLSIIKKQGFECSDFDLSEIDKTKINSRSLDSSTIELVPIVGDAVVTRKSTNLSRSYLAGHNQSWVVDFQKELAEGVFGNPYFP